MSTAFCRGPCCESAVPPHAPKQELPSELTGIQLAVVDTITAVEGDVTVDHVAYLGSYRMVTVTEFMCRPPTVAAGGATPSLALKHKLSTELASCSLSELDKLDAEMMLGMLGGSSCDDTTMADPALQPILIATGKLFLDAEGDVVEHAGFLDSPVHTSVSTLGQLRPRESSYWLDFSPLETGNLLLSHPVLGNCDSDASHLRARLFSEVERLTTAVRRFIAALDLKSYENPFRRILFLQSDDTVDESYREFRGVRVELRRLATSTLPEDRVAAEVAPPIAAATLHIDVATAATDPPSQCAHTFAVDGVSTGVFVRLDVNCRRGVGSLFVRGCDGNMDTIPLGVIFSCVCLPNGSVVGEGIETIASPHDSDQRTLTVAARLQDATVPLRLFVQGCFVFGSGAVAQ